ncbi:helix-turn-helix domain-containing protein [Plantactinospora sp. CA-290183]|uniref:helix-turn-helix domain-containing protein n=1 Tax=Plantactinospora sp. CA-290183 TaxID=3240006 RepID=UPI003D906B3F
MTQPDWPARLVKVIAGEVKRHRQARSMSAQQLADACAELGHPIARSVLANLENGRRPTISVPELLVLALALQVPPMLLIVPLGHAESVEVAPGVAVPATEAMRWIRGEAWVLKPPPEGADGSAVVASFVTHHSELSRWEWARYYASRIRSGEIEGTEQEAERHDADAERSLAHLENLRQLMRARGLTPPPAPEQLRLRESQP